MAAQPANNYASASPHVSPNTSPSKLKPTPPKMLTIQELGVSSSNFQVRVLVDHIGDPRFFNNGQGSILRVQLSDAEASITGVAFNMVAKYVAKSLEVGKTYLLSKCIAKAQYGGGHGIELHFTEQTAFTLDAKVIVPATKTFSDLEASHGVIYVKATITNVVGDVAYFGCTKCNTKNHQMATDCGKCGCEALSWRLKLAVTMCDEDGTSKDIVLWENVAKHLLNNADLHTEEDRNQARDQCFELIGTNATFKFQVRQNDNQTPNMTCIGVQVNELRGEEEQEQEVQAESCDEEDAVSSPPPMFQLTSKLVTISTPVVPIRRTTSTRKTENDVILINDQVPTAPFPPHATSRQITPTIAVKTQVPSRTATKTPAKKPKTTK